MLNTTTFLKDNHGDLNYFKSKDIHLNPVIKAISVDFVKGLYYMVNHFGVEILTQVDDLGFSVFLIAVHYLSSKCTKYIATVCPDQIKNTDINGNIALHIAIKTNSSKVNKFVKAVADIGIDWEHKNSSGKLLLPY
jgi:predicted transcriptional regulator